MTPEATAGTAVTAIVAARNEADRIGATLDTLREAFPGATLWVADDASTDGTAEVALAHGAKVVSRGRPHGKGANVTAAAEAMLSEGEPEGVVLLCDGDLGETAGRLPPLTAAVAGGGCDLAIAAFARRVGGGFGVALGFSRWTTERLGGVTLAAPISGQRAIRAEKLRGLLPFARGYGMETAMNIDAARAGLRIEEVQLDLEHRATGRTLRGFGHRGRQLADFLRVYLSRRFRG
ncbi:MAG TPA: glycosyltransferase family 2 protein [Solirubrobacterales bacterium]